MKKQTSVLAIDICSKFSLEDEDSKILLIPNKTISLFLQDLIDHKIYRDAIRFLAHTLPKREAVWWACSCIRSADIPLKKESIDSLEATESWVRTLSDEDRLRTKKTADIEKLETPTSWAAISAFWSEGSITPKDAPVVLAPDNLSFGAVSGAIMLAGVIQNPEKSEDIYQKFLRQGIDIGNGGNGKI